MTEQEKFEFNSELLKQLEGLEGFLMQEIAKFKERFEGCKKSTQYELHQEFRAVCDSIQGLLADMSNELEMVRRAKANLR